MSRFRPAIDLHNGQVKQIVGGSLRDDGSEPLTNFVAQQSPAEFAQMFARDALIGGHVIKLGPGNETAAREALAAWPQGLQIGGGINAHNATQWIDAGASKIIVTSWCFVDGQFSEARAEELAQTVGREHVVLDLSCRRDQSGWRIATDRWQTVTDTHINGETLQRLSTYAAEYLIHAADVEGLCQGIDADLVALMGDHCPIPSTYAGGVASLADMDLVATRSAGRVDVTVGSALDIYGGSGVRYSECVAWNQNGHS